MRIYCFDSSVFSLCRILSLGRRDLTIHLGLSACGACVRLFGFWVSHSVPYYLLVDATSRLFFLLLLAVRDPVALPVWNSHIVISSLLVDATSTVLLHIVYGLAEFGALNVLFRPSGELSQFLYVRIRDLNVHLPADLELVGGLWP